MSTGLFFSYAEYERQMWTAMFGWAIQMWRRSRHLTVRQTARRAGMEPERWRAIEQGELAPAPDQLHQLALGLNLSLADLEELAQCCEPMWGPGQEGASGPAYS